MSKFIPRTSKPAKGNKYYLTKSTGGWNPCVKGSPTDPDCNVLHNCVGYAVGRFNEVAETGAAMNWLRSTNAENFVSVAKSQGLTVSNTPSLGAVVCWAKGKVGDGSDGAGHVAVVEAIYSDGTIVTSESGYNAKKPFWTQRRSKGADGNWGQSSAYKFLGFIKNPKTFDESGEYPEPTRVLRKGSTGDDVKWLQQRLKDLKYYCGDVDGYFGTYTLGSLLAFQFENDLEVDGACGSKTRAALSK